jgi:D-alanyl-D-alanine carboxypeptidase/D-alanyl-D-alanine-endopeptidase (penicillin-binding protein 4)
MSASTMAPRLAILAALAALPGVTGAVAGASELASRVDRALADRGLRGAQVGIVVADLGSGEVLYEREPDTPLVPASLTKLATSAAALWSLDPDYRFRTVLLGGGRKEGERYVGDLHLKAWGDPVLVEERLWVLAEQLRQKGIRRVDGDVVVDDSYFDLQRFGADWKPSRASYRAPNGAVSVNFNTTRLRGRALAIADDPADNAGRELLRMLAGEGIAVSGGVRSGAPSPAAPVLAESESKSLGAIVADLNKLSNNFIAEQLLKTMGAERLGPPGTAEKGLQVVADYLSAIGVDPRGARLHDGSGLSPSNRITARAVVRILSETVRDFRVGPEFLASLRIAGVEGGPGRFRDPLCLRKLRVKTGHLDGVAALAGYGESAAGRRLVFAILVNDYRRGRRAADRGIEQVCEAFLGADARHPITAVAGPGDGPDGGSAEEGD